MSNWPPPMLWPITKRGALGGQRERRNECMSARTRVVGPVKPRSEGLVTERPQPLVDKYVR